MRAPPHLAAETRKWFTSVAATYDLEPHHLRLLQLAGEAWDRCQQAREAIAKEGLTVPSGTRADPAISIDRDSRLAFARLIRELDRDAEPPSAWRAGPPALHSNRRTARNGRAIALDD